MSAWRSVAPGRRTRGWVLVVDDEREVRDLIAAWLKREGYRVVTASDARIAGKRVDEVLASGGTVATLVADVYLPGQSGFALAHRTREICPDVHVVFVSGVTDPDPPPGVSILSKPFGPDALLRLVQQGFDRTIGV